MDFVDEYYADRDLSLLKKLTVVIPTYNRNYYLSRCLWYHSHFPFGEIIVADSSPEEKKVVNRETVRKLVELRGVNIRYLEYPPETEKYGRDITRKWADAVQHVETEYSQICTDKEFLVPRTLCKCIAFLDEHGDYDLATGSRYYIRSLKSGNIGYFEESPGRSLSLDYPEPLARLLAFSVSRPYPFNLLSLRRSHVHKEMYNKLLRYGIDDIRFGEHGLELVSVVSSKSIYFPNEPHEARDLTQLFSSRRIKRSTPESSATRYPSYNGYAQNGLYADSMDRLVSCLTHEYLASGPSTMTVQEVNELMKIAIINLQNVSGFFRKPQSEVSEVVLHWGMLILSKLPDKISTYMRRVLNRPEQPPIANIPDEFQIIAQILIKTLYLHKKDEPLRI
jgi:glycosyltransferase domain-containing protein